MLAGLTYKVSCLLTLLNLLVIAEISGASTVLVLKLQIELNSNQS